MPKQNKLLKLFLLLFAMNLMPHLFGQKIHCKHTIDTNQNYINGVPHQAGDTFCISPGTRSHLYLSDLSGTEDEPIIFINNDGMVNIESEIGYGISISNCQHIKILGSGSNHEYGIHISEVSSGSGIKADNMTSDIEIANIEISNTKYTGITAKSDPNCQFNSTLDSFTMFNTHIHHNYIHDVGTEGMYIGHSFFTGVYLDDCDTTVQPHILDGVDIHHNIIERSGWDGIQLGCALYHSKIHHNRIYEDSQAERVYQMSGIMVNPGSACDVYNNIIVNGKGTGIALQGIGGQKIYNNLIVNPGRGYQEENQTSAQKFGIFCKYTINIGNDSSFLIANNTIINPKSDGIRFQNNHSSNNRFYNNIIVNPGAFDYYNENGNVSNTGSDSYIYFYYPEIEFDTSNNVLARSSKNLFFMDTLDYNYKLSSQSPMIDQGINIGEYNIHFDLDDKYRPNGEAYDIGAYEYFGVGTSSIEIEKLNLIPNPFKSDIHFQNVENKNIKSLTIYNSRGDICFYKYAPKSNYFDLKNLSKGIYIAQIISSTESAEIIKLIKL